MEGECRVRASSCEFTRVRASLREGPVGPPLAAKGSLWLVLIKEGDPPWTHALPHPSLPPAAPTSGRAHFSWFPQASNSRRRAAPGSGPALHSGTTGGAGAARGAGSFGEGAAKREKF